MIHGRQRIAVIGSGIYGASISIKLAEKGCHVSNFDPLGILMAASAINQYRIHSGYHYPRSADTIKEILETAKEFKEVYYEAIVNSNTHYYAIPKNGSLTSPDDYEKVMTKHDLLLRECRPSWLDFGFIDRCYEVEEQLYDPIILRDILKKRYHELQINFIRRLFDQRDENNYDYVIWATYGLQDNRPLFANTKIQVAEKVTIDLPSHLKNISLVVVDGPFTAFDPIGESQLSLFGSARYTNHWASVNQQEDIPIYLKKMINRKELTRVSYTRFPEMLSDCCKSVPSAQEAKYLGSKFTIRVTEDASDTDRRILQIKSIDEKTIQVFSGKVVGAVKAAKLVAKIVCDE